MTPKEVEETRLRRSEDLCKLVEGIGYNTEPRQLQCNNGAHVSSLLHFFDDNPGAMEALQEWILNNSDLDEDEDECEEEDEDVGDGFKAAITFEL